MIRESAVDVPSEIELLMTQYRINIPSLISQQERHKVHLDKKNDT